MNDMQNHLLIKNNVSTSIVSWETWKKRWDEELARHYPHAEVLMGLLHAVFKRFYPVQTACLCLDVACGYKYPDEFDEIAHNWYASNYGRIYYPRGEVAKKAWKELCNNVFKNTSQRSHEPPSWAWLVVQPDIFHKLLWFFRVSKSERENNVPFGHGESHHEKLALTFLREFIAFTWKFQPSTRGSSVEEEEAVRKMFVEARPQFVEILAEMHELKLLLHEDMEIDKPALQKLEEIALEPSTSGEKPPSSLEEAYASDSFPSSNVRAAKVLILLNIRQKEMKRQEEIAEATLQGEQANDKLTELSVSVK